jgi:hypothetical protein
MTFHQLLKATLVLSVVLAAVASPALAGKSPHGGGPASSRQEAAQVIRVSGRGFDWGDAGIGAAAGVGLSMLAVGGGLVIAGIRRRELIAGEATICSADALKRAPLARGRARVVTQEQEAK